MIVVVGRFIFSQRTSKSGDSRSMSLATAVYVTVSTDTTFRVETRVKVIAGDLEGVRGRLT